MINIAMATVASEVEQEGMRDSQHDTRSGLCNSYKLY